MKPKTSTQIKCRLESLGFKFFTEGEYNLNIIGIRSKVLDTNDFNDELYCIYKEADIWCVERFQITTEPGFKSLRYPSNPKGTAILCPGQYEGSHEIGLHKGKYKALVQRTPMKVYRDSNRDLAVDLNPKSVDKGVFGINIHKAGRNSKIVDDWSAGCQVFKTEADFDRFMELCEISAIKYGNSFTYTLLDDWT